MAKQKKQSIREFVNEDGIKFQLYYLKLANQLKQIEDITEEEIIKKWEYNTQKKINRYTNDLTKFTDDIAQTAIEYNIEYVRNLPAPTDPQKIQEQFSNIKKDYITSLEKRIELDETATLKLDKALLEYVNEVELKSIVSKEKFGEMLLLMIKNLATMPSFSGYSDNWKTDFFSNAIEKTLLYLDNFDEELRSKRTGQKSKAFAYVTQICFNAFVNIINIRKKEDAFLKDTISLETANIDGIKKYAKSGHQIQEDKEERMMSKLRETGDDSIHEVKIKTLKELDLAIKKGVAFINDNNEIFDNNKATELEIEYLDKDTPEEEKTQDYDDYVKDLKMKIVPELLDKKLTVLKIIKPSSVILDKDWKTPSDVMGDIRLIIQEKIKKIKKVPEPETKEDEMPEVPTELEDFNNEW